MIVSMVELQLNSFERGVWVCVCFTLKRVCYLQNGIPTFKAINQH